MADEPTQPACDEEASRKAEARERQLSGLREHRVKPGQVLNPEGKNGHRARQELIAAILDEAEDDPKAPEPGQSRIRNVVLSLARETYAGGPGAGGSGKALVEQYAGKPRAQVELSNPDGSLAPPVVNLNFGKKPPEAPADEPPPQPVAAETPTDGH